MLIAIDWGTTSFRAYLFEKDGTILERISAAAGIMQVEDSAFESVFYARVGNWLSYTPEPAIIASGMITSKQGWVETPYLPCPASLGDLSKNLTTHPTSRNHTIHFVSGVCQHEPVPNIMRGEETQMAGLSSKEAMTAILPGTHSKWIRMEGDTIQYFSTFMTGEIFAALTQHTILGRLLTEGADPQGFIKGVEDGFSAKQEAGGILSKLFGARAMPLLELMNQDSIKEYISGLLLGTEIKEAVDSGYGLNVTPVICGSADLVSRYQKALELTGIPTESGEEDLAARGLFRIAETAGLL